MRRGRGVRLSFFLSIHLSYSHRPEYLGLEETEREEADKTSHSTQPTHHPTANPTPANAPHSLAHRPAQKPHDPHRRRRTRLRGRHALSDG